MDWQALLERQPGLARIPRPLQAQARRVALEAGQLAFRSGDRVGSMLAVISGEICLVRRSRNGAEVVLQRSRGGFLAEASLNNTVYHCDAVAARVSTVLRFPIKVFREALDADAPFRDAWTMRLADEVRRLRAQCERLSLHGAADRVLHYVESEGCGGALVLRQSRKAWAAELGLTHEALYRTLSTLRADGRLHIEGQVISITSGVGPAHSAARRTGPASAKCQTP